MPTLAVHPRVGKRIWHLPFFSIGKDLTVCYGSHGSFNHYLKFRSQASDVWTDAATVVRAAREEKESEEKESEEKESEEKEPVERKSVERRSKCTKS